MFDERISANKPMKEQLMNLDLKAEYKQSLNDDTLNLKNDTLNDTLKLSEKETAVLKLIKSNLNITANEIAEQSRISKQR